MPSVLDTLFLIIFIIEFTVGIGGNGFIILVNSIDWMKKRKILLIDFVLTCLAISRILFLWVTISSISLEFFYEKILLPEDLNIICDVLWIGSNYFCMSCTTCLSVLYFFKIANFSHSVFLWMKKRIHKLLLVITVVAVLSFCKYLILKKTLANRLVHEWIPMTKNSTCNLMEVLLDILTSHIIIHMVPIIFFVVTLISFLLLILSLWSHTRQMKLHGIYSRDSSTEVHVKAMKAMMSFLLLFLVHYFSHAVVILTYYFPDSTVTKISAYVIIFFYPSGHPLLLILWHSKLKQASVCVLQKIKCVRDHNT
ncbi:taste receptor type 2 member 7-like [Ochotona curzoniae]|uniref:taste receptor type 2 member 7-like n=1 Tax=Ochotona curzoniae TaxID=130825 RepID=UPI001B34D1F2|nr:taste receptor type 2 member 7-like [Ochotona curzoniae]